METVNCPILFVSCYMKKYSVLIIPYWLDICFVFFFLLGVPELKRTHRSAQMSDTESWLLFSAVLCATLLHSAFAIFSNF